MAPEFGQVEWFVAAAVLPVYLSARFNQRLHTLHVALARRLVHRGDPVIILAIGWDKRRYQLDMENCVVQSNEMVIY